TFPTGDQQRELIANFYLALFGRPTDPSDLAFWENALDPSQESLRQMDEALKQAVAKQAAEKIPSAPLVNEYDPWGSYIYVARQERSPALPETGLYAPHHAYYKGDVRGTVGDE